LLTAAGAVLRVAERYAFAAFSSSRWRGVGAVDGHQRIAPSGAPQTVRSVLGLTAYLTGFPRVEAEDRYTGGEKLIAGRLPRSTAAEVQIDATAQHRIPGNQPECSPAKESHGDD
jgi:hypothetical protein